MSFLIDAITNLVILVDQAQHSMLSNDKSDSVDGEYLHM